MTVWLSIAVALMRGAAAIFAYLRDKQLLDAGAAMAALDNLKAANDAIDRANIARERVRADLERSPDRVRDHDPFERGD